MAKLSANGKELLRIEKELEHPNDELITWSRTTKAVMSSGKILQKRDVRFKPSPYRPNGEFYSYGWKVHGKVKTGKTAPDVVNVYLKSIADNPGTHWRVITGGPKPVILSQSRIIRAIESGEHIGFCKACGASQGYCEPDARNYKCESCDMHEVYGAEECLIS